MDAISTPSQPRDVDGKVCALRCCGKPILPSEDGVRVPAPHKRLGRIPGGAAARAQLAVAWDVRCPRAYFHALCWAPLLVGARLAGEAPLLAQGGPAAARAPRRSALVLTPLPRPLSAEDVRLVQACYESAELFEPTAVARAVARDLAARLLASKHTTAFTGAGISVAAGISDYRGSAGIDVLKDLGVAEGAEPRPRRAGDDSEEGGSAAGGASGTGKRCAAEQEGGAAAGEGGKRAKAGGGGKGAAAAAAAAAAEPEPEAAEAEGGCFYSSLKPTRTHRFLKALHDQGRLQYLVTQNCDGLHLRSGIPRSALTEVHGNVFVEFCPTCSCEYVREQAVDSDSTWVAPGQVPWYTRCGQCGWNHATGRLCAAPGCRGRLRDTIVNFSDSLWDTVCGGYLRAEEHCRRAELVLCLGTSLTVTPASELPTLMGSKRATLAIVNLQATELDSLAQLRLFYDLQAFTVLVEEELTAAGSGGGGGGGGGGMSGGGGGGSSSSSSSSSSSGK